MYTYEILLLLIMKMLTCHYAYGKPHIGAQACRLLFGHLQVYGMLIFSLIFITTLVCTQSYIDSIWGMAILSLLLEFDYGIEP